MSCPAIDRAAPCNPLLLLDRISRTYQMSDNEAGGVGVRHRLLARHMAAVGPGAGIHPAAWDPDMDGPFGAELLTSDSDNNSDDNSESEEEEEEEEEPRPRPRIELARQRVAGGPPELRLNNFWRLVANIQRGEAPATHDDLINKLRDARVLKSDIITKAMKMCPRDAFVKEDQRARALYDEPLRLDDLNFNISAPHMHAQCLEALNIQPGQWVLDVGCGCGILTACAAFLVGKGGFSMGIDVKKGAVSFSRANVKRLSASNAEYAAITCACKFEEHNVFMPSIYKGRFDRIHVGASCPEELVEELIAWLRPAGGLIVTPVAPSSLVAITLQPDGTLKRKELAQVRYGDLEIPSRAEVLVATLDLERRQKTALPMPPSTFASDISSITGSSCGSSGSDQSGFLGGEEDGTPRRWPKRVAKFLTACSGSLLSSGSSGSSSPGRMSLDGSENGRGEGAQLDPQDLGALDCVLIGSGWEIPAHRSVLRARCDQFRARCESGMRDAFEDKLHVPEHFTREAIEVFLRYLYHDTIDMRIDIEMAIAVLHVAHYYGAPRLVGLCEVILAKELKRGSPRDEGTAETAAGLLALADEADLPHLKAVALDFIVRHFPLVSSTSAYAALSKRQADLVAAEACQVSKRMEGLLKQMVADQKLDRRSMEY
ncbi:hypothetical protein WJX72_012529 [[Myrmecia] bisecta]|uniref:protein-L-isoaspartate(D-aspartate) O-methyltransferase n=1 Tax=[Myrmecia] bisecta TaxID=41462 RepID=A0AAW1PG14_9CHLO